MITFIFWLIWVFFTFKAFKLILLLLQLSFSICSIAKLFSILMLFCHLITFSILVFVYFPPSIVVLVIISSFSFLTQVYLFIFSPLPLLVFLLSFSRFVILVSEHVFNAFYLFKLVLLILLIWLLIIKVQRDVAIEIFS